MDTARYVAQLTAAAKQLDSRAADLQAELEQVDAGRKALREIIARHGAGQPTAAECPVSDEEIRQIGNRRLSLRRIAELSPDQTVHLRTAARWIHNADPQGAKRDSVRATLLRYVKQSSDWEDAGDGRFRLVGDSEINRPTPPAGRPESEPASPDAGVGPVSGADPDQTLPSVNTDGGSPTGQE